MLEYYGRNVGVKILPTGVKPERLLAALEWQDTVWRRGELLDQVRHCFGLIEAWSVVQVLLTGAQKLSLPAVLHWQS